MTAYTAPWAAAININSVTCGCCDTRWWPEVAPLYPESYICEVCLQWLRLYDRAQEGLFPVFGPIRAIRKILTGQPITAGEFFTDHSPWVHIRNRDVFQRLKQLVEEAKADDPDDHIPASKVRG